MGVKCRECEVVYDVDNAIKEFGYRTTEGTINYHRRCIACRESPKPRKPEPQAPKPEKPQITCNKCAVSIDLDKADELFDRRKGRTTGYQYSCKKCRRKQGRKYRDRLSEEQRDIIRERERQRRHKRNEAASVKKREHAKKIKGYAEHIDNNEPVGTTARTFHFGLRLLLEKQLDLYYDDIKSITGTQKKRGVIEDALYEFKDILARVSDRMKRISDAEPATPLEDSLEDVNGRKRVDALLVLGLPGTASDEEIKKRYKSLAQEAHPDRGGSAEKMAEINAAMSMLEER